MELVLPSKSSLAVLRSVSRASFRYTLTKELCEAAGWRKLDDEPELGYVRYAMRFADDSEMRSLLSVRIAESNLPPWAFVPLYYFEEYKLGREPFDQAFEELSSSFIELFGATSHSGTYDYPHRKDWTYSYHGWSLDDCTLILVQDEMDIQFGMDVTLWVEPAGNRIEVPIMYE